MAPIPLVLASASPARLETLQRAGIFPSVLVSDLDEDALLEQATRESEARGAGPLLATDAVLHLAQAKCLAVVQRHSPDALVLGCDSMLELGGQMYGKPANGVVARQRWRMMRGNEGWLHTGHWLVDARDVGTLESIGETSSTRVQFAHLSDAEIDAYVDTGEPLKVAGAFTVDGLGGPYVTHIEGDYHNVVGLSLPLLRDLLGRVGIAIHELRSPVVL